MRKRTAVATAAFLAVGLLFCWAGTSQADEEKLDCIMCPVGMPADPSMHEYYKGHRIGVCSLACRAAYLEAKAKGLLSNILSRFEPRSALFHEDETYDPGLQRLATVNFALGLYVLLGLIFGGLSSYSALHKGQPGWKAFGLGFALNAVGLLIVRSWTKKEMLFSSAGLSKIPTTHDELVCSSCGHANHPAARQCAGCKGPLHKAVESDIDRVR